MKIVVLGSGTSHGIPVVGCDCPVCTSDDERDKRMRSSVYIEGRAGEKVLIDAGPEFRLQAVRAGIKALDAVFLTHSHADHIHGLDDLRSLSYHNSIPVYGNKVTISDMKNRFSYIWGKSQIGGGKPRLTPKLIDKPLSIDGLTFTPVPVKHGTLDILGWEVREDKDKSFLYLTDTSAISTAAMRQLCEVGLWQSRIIIIGGLRIRFHETHFNFEQALNTALSLGANSIYLTHICHNHSHVEIEKFCQHFKTTQSGSESVEIHPAQDGLVLEV